MEDSSEMIHHLSIPAKDPLRTGRLFAKLFDAELLNFPAVRGAVTVLKSDGSGFAIEIWPDTANQKPGEGEFDARLPRAYLCGTEAASLGLSDSL